jgi:methionyl-tRNA formyltransferase
VRHKRFAYRIMAEFGDAVVAWYELDASMKSSGSSSAQAKNQAPQGKLQSLTSRIVPMIREKGAVTLVKQVLGGAKTWYYVRKHYKGHAEAERRVFAGDIERLKPLASCEPIRIPMGFVHDDAFVEQLKQHNPYFFLTLGGPLYKKKVLDAVRGAAINQHAGHSPDYKGSQTVEWALYHRDLRRVSATVHLTGTGADSGPILRRSAPCLFHTDDVATIFARVVAVGTELMVEAVHSIIENKEVVVFEQPATEGRTYLSKEVSTDVLPFVLSDFRRGWLAKALLKQRSY